MPSLSFSWTDDPAGSLFPESDYLIKPINDEEFNSFHFIDRELYSQLIFNHGRDALESMHVMAFWLWLEREKYCPMKLVFKILHELPPHLVAQVADETVLCLKCIENDLFIYSVTNQDILLLQSLMEGKSINLGQLYQDRMSIVSKVTEIANEICWRAFKDILEMVFRGPGPSAVVNPNQASGSGTSNRYIHNANLMSPVRGIPVYPGQLVGFMGVPTRCLANDIGGSAGGVPSNQMVVPPPPPNQMVVVAPQGQNSHFNPYAHLPHHPEGEEEGLFINPFDLHHGQGGEEEMGVVNSHFIDPYDLQHMHHQQQMEAVNLELGEMMNNVHIAELNPEHNPEVEETEEDVPADDRTIFLTFSKGYPLSEDDVREFFTRRYGDFIEGVFMQEVPEGEQSLFARVVCRRASAIERVAPRGSRAKFAINGKHVWARKYIKKSTSTRLAQQAMGAGPALATAAHP